MLRHASAATLAALTLALALPAQAQGDGDPAKGKSLYNQCMACHALQPGQHRVGPSLANVWGREAGTAEGFNRYSPAMRESDVVWNAETLDAYLADPKGFIPGNNMTYPGVSNAEQRGHIIAYLKQETQ